MSKVFKNIARFTNSSEHLITIELEIGKDDYKNQRFFKSETFQITDTDTCSLVLSRTVTKHPLLVFNDLTTQKPIIGCFTTLVFDTNGDIVHHFVKPKVGKISDLLYNFKLKYSSAKFPIKIVCFLNIKNAVDDKKLETDSCDSDQVNCLQELSSDLLKLHEKDIGTDVTLRADGVDIKAHKAILRARSAVFNKMFEHDTSESSDNVIDIKEISAPIIKEFLAFLYTGMKKNHNFDTTRDLYYLADKYEVLSLRDVCKKHLLRHHLREDNACQLFVLADQHGDELNKKEVMSFIKINLKSIIKTKPFEEFSKNYPNLALSLMRNHFSENCS